MPELPEVEIFRRFMERHALRQNITAVQVLHPKGLRSVSEADFQNALVGNRFVETQRRGKYLLARLEPANTAPQRTKTKRKASLQTNWVVFHFGMTGIFSYASPQQKPVNAYEDDLNRESHIRVSFLLENGGKFHFHDQRLFGYVSLTEQADTFFASKKLGPDALTVDAQEFEQKLKGKKGALKPVLMDQSIVAGLGNIYADELLFQTALHPAHPIHTLSSEQRLLLHSTMQDILNRTIALKVDRDQLPDHYLWHQRQAKGHCPRDGSALNIETIGGRTTYYCPECQH